MTAYMHVSTAAGAAEIKFGNAWTSTLGERARIDIGAAELILDSPAQADALIAAATQAKAELIRLEAERKAAEDGESS